MTQYFPQKDKCWWELIFNIQILFSFTHRSSGIMPQCIGPCPNKVNSIWSTIPNLGLKENKNVVAGGILNWKSKVAWWRFCFIFIFKVFRFSSYELWREVSVQKLSNINIHFSSWLGYTFLFHGTAFTL